jgi:hypothetical protein
LIVKVATTWGTAPFEVPYGEYTYCNKGYWPSELARQSNGLAYEAKSLSKFSNPRKGDYSEIETSEFGA